MPHIPLREDLPGIRGLLEFKPSSGRPVAALIQHLLRGPSPLLPAERERIATYVSQLNECEFCARSHAATVRHLEAPAADSGVVVAGARLGALLEIAAAVVRGGSAVSDADVARAREAGADDESIHDTVLIAAAFCMLNRYVDGLGAITPHAEAAYDAMGARLAVDGYLGAAPGEDARQGGA